MTRTLPLALVAALAAAAAAEAATPISIPRPLKKITKVSEFTGRQSPTFVPRPIVIQAMDVTGGQNLAAARKAVEDAMAKTQAELTDQGKLVGGLQGRLGAIDQHAAGLQAERAGYVAQRDQYQEELGTLQGFGTPSQAIKDCMAELEGYIAQADAQIKNVDDALATDAARREFLVKAGASAKNNEAKLKEALAHLKDALAALGKVNMPTVKPELLKGQQLKIQATTARVKTPMTAPTPRPTIRRMPPRGKY